MYVNVSKRVYKNKTYYAVRIFQTYYRNGKRVNKIIKTIGNTTDPKEVEKLKRIAYSYIIRMHKDIKLTLSDIKKIKPHSPAGLIKTVEQIFINLEIYEHLRKIFRNNYEEFIDEIVYRFYPILSERMLCLITGKPKDRYYRLLDDIYMAKREIENIFYNALVKKGKIVCNKVKIDSTSTYFEGNGPSLAMYGYSRDHREDRKQIIILLVLIDDFPLFSYIYEGNAKDVRLFAQIIKDIKERTKCKKMMLISDRGFFHPDHLDFLDSQKIEYILAVPRRKSNWYIYYENKTDDFILEGRRAILYENTELRKKLLEELDDTILKIRNDLDVLSPSEIKRKYNYALKFIDLKRKKIKTKIVEKEKMILGRWIVITNNWTATREEIINEYKSLQKIERDFHILKSELNIRPIHHRKDERVIAHITLCVLTLLIKQIIEKELGREMLEKLKEMFSYEIITDKGTILWEENL